MMKNRLRTLGILVIVCLLLTGCVVGQVSAKQITVTVNGVTTTQEYEGTADVDVQYTYSSGVAIVTTNTSSGVQKVTIPITR